MSRSLAIAVVLAAGLAAVGVARASVARKRRADQIAAINAARNTLRVHGIAAALEAPATAADGVTVEDLDAISLPRKVWRRG